MGLFRNAECLKQLLKLVKQYLDSSLELQQATTKISKKQDSQDQQNLNLKIQQEHDSANTLKCVNSCGHYIADRGLNQNSRRQLLFPGNHFNAIS